MASKKGEGYIYTFIHLIVKIRYFSLAPYIQIYVKIHLFFLYCCSCGTADDMTFSKTSKKEVNKDCNGNAEQSDVMH